MAAATGCASSTEGLEMELSMLRREVRSLRDKVTENELALERLEGRMTLVALGGDAAVAPAPKTPVATSAEPATKKVGEPKISRIAGPSKALPVVKLSHSPIDEPYEEGALDDGSPPILIELGSAAGEGDRLPVDHEVLERRDPVLHDPPAAKKVTPAEIRAAYEIARAKLRVEKKAGEARELLLRFESDFPSSRYADNVAFWLAECDLEEGRHRSAIAAYAKMMADHPRSPKVPDALLRLSEAYRAIGEPERASEMLTKLRAEHPSSEAARSSLAGVQGRR
jgi:TolA-binding protein